MSCALRPTAARCTSTSYAHKPAAAASLLRQLARFNPNQLSSYHGVKLLLPTKGRVATVPQGSAAARKPAQMSFLGVGAPEALLVAVVALVVFGPKGLADAARSLGSALRAFQPTIKEVVQVSQELKGTLEKELGIDELRDAARPAPRASTDPLDAPKGPVPDVMAKALDPEIEAKRAASAQMAWGSAAASTAAPEAAAAAPAEAPAAAPAAAAAATTVAAASAAPAPAPAAAPLKDISSMSMEELEAELSRRRAAATGGDKRQ